MVICLEKRSVVLSLGGSQWAAFSLVFVFFCSFVVCLVSHFFPKQKWRCAPPFWVSVAIGCFSISVYVPCNEMDLLVPPTNCYQVTHTYM